jgi:hypothetical protein
MRFGRYHGCRARYLAIGGLCGGSVFSSRALSGRTNGNCRTLPGATISATAVRADQSAARCPASSPGNPTVRPNGYSIAAIRGTLTAAVKSGILDKLMVLKPASSICRWTSPTDQQHTGQAGTRTTTSTASSRSLSMMAGTLSSSNRSGWQV